jgi:hypothetical protein
MNVQTPYPPFPSERTTIGVTTSPEAIAVAYTA